MLDHRRSPRLSFRNPPRRLLLIKLTQPRRQNREKLEFKIVFRFQRREAEGEVGAIDTFEVLGRGVLKEGV